MTKSYSTISAGDFKKIKVGDIIKTIDDIKVVPVPKRNHVCITGVLLKVVDNSQLEMEQGISKSLSLNKMAQVRCEDGSWYFREYIERVITKEDNPEYFL